MANGRKVHHYVSAVVLIILGLVTAALLYVTSVENRVSESEVPVIDDSQAVVDFDSCVAAGNPVMESFPEQCSADGQTYVKITMGTGIEKDKLPAGWMFYGEAGSGAAEFNDGMGGDESLPTCTLTAQSFPLGTETEESLLEARVNKLLDSKQYEGEIVGTTQHSILVNDELKLVKFNQLQFKNGASEIEQLVGYEFGSNDYSEILVSCTNGMYQGIVGLFEAVRVVTQNN